MDVGNIQDLVALDSAEEPTYQLDKNPVPMPDLVCSHRRVCSFNRCIFIEPGEEQRIKAGPSHW